MPGQTLQQLLDEQQQNPQQQQNPGPHTTAKAHRRHPFTFGTYNIRSGRNSSLQIAIRSIQQCNHKLAFLTETKLTDGIYTRHFLGYNVSATNAPSPHQGGVALVYQEPTASDPWSIESIQKHGQNCMSWVFVSADLRIPMIGAYLTPQHLNDLPHVQRAFDRFTGSQHHPILMGDFNADVHDPTSERNREIAEFFALNGVSDLLPHFRQRRHFRHKTTWFQHRYEPQPHTIRSRCDYICGSDRRLFQKVSIRRPRYDTDHFMVSAVLLSSLPKSHKKYLQGRRRLPLQTPKWGPLKLVDAVFQELKSWREPRPQGPRPRPNWISPATLRLLDQRCALRRNRSHDRTLARQLTRQINTSLTADRKARTETAGSEIETALARNEPQEAWNIMKRWYRHAGDRPPKPSRDDLQQVTAERIHLYTRVPPQGPPIPIHVQATPVLDTAPTDDEIREAVLRLRNNRASGPSKLRAEDVKSWLRAAERDEDPDPTQWDCLTNLVRHCYMTSDLPTELSWSIICMLPKPDGGHRGIGLLEVVWKLLATIIDRRCNAIRLHDCLHGFISRRGTSTAIIEFVLAHQLASIDQETLHAVFIDLKKAYDCVDRERSLLILQAYGVGPNALRLLTTFWDQLQMVARQSGYHGPVFNSTRGCTQGCVFSPKLFNIILDAVLRHWLSLVIDDAGTIVSHGFGLSVADRFALFYADDGLIGARNADWLQNALQVLTDLFLRIGLDTNTAKTVTMNCIPGYISTQLSVSGYTHRLTGTGESYSSRKRRRINCPRCNQNLSSASLKSHLRTVHGEEMAPAPLLTDLLPPQTFTISFPKILKRRQCPVPNCCARPTTWPAMRNHFKFRHPKHMVHILEESLAPFPKCPRCCMQLRTISQTHYQTQVCQQGHQLQLQRNAAIAAAAAQSQTFTVGANQLSVVPQFKYLGRYVCSNGSDYPALYKNLIKARQRWAHAARILARDNANPRIAGKFYKAIVQSVLLYSSETWTITPQLMSVLEGFHHRVARRISRMTPTRQPNGDWVYPPIEDALEAAGLYPVQTYVGRRQATLVDSIATRPIYTLCTNSTRRPGSASRLRWWTQPLGPPPDDDPTYHPSDSSSSNSTSDTSYFTTTSGSLSSSTDSSYAPSTTSSDTTYYTTTSGSFSSSTDSSYAPSSTSSDSDASYHTATLNQGWFNDLNLYGSDSDTTDSSDHYEYSESDDSDDSAGAADSDNDDSSDDSSTP